MGSNISSLSQEQIDGRKQERDQMIADAETHQSALKSFYSGRFEYWKGRRTEESSEQQLSALKSNLEQFASATAARDAACERNIYDAFASGKFDTECLGGGHQKFSSAHSPQFIRSLKNYSITPVVEQAPVGDIEGIVCYKPQVTKWKLTWEK